MSDDAAPSRFKRAEEFVFLKVPHVLAGVLFLVAAGINIANVIARYVFSAPVFWAEEALVYLVIWTVFLVAISITYRGAHLNMDLFYAKLKTPWKELVNLAIALTFIACTAFTAAQSCRVVLLYVRTGSVSTAAEIPLVIPNAAPLFGFSFMALAVILRFRTYVFGKFD